MRKTSLYPDLFYLILLCDTLMFINCNGELKSFDISPRSPLPDMYQLVKFGKLHMQDGMLPVIVEAKSWYEFDLQRVPEDSPSIYRYLSKLAEQTVEGNVPWKQFLLDEINIAYEIQ